MLKAMSIQDSFDSDSTEVPILDQEDVFEEFSEVDINAFIDAQFESVFKEEGIIHPENEEGMKAIPLEAQLGAARSCLFTDNFTFERDSLMFDIDTKLAVPHDQGELLCSQCNKTLTEGEAESSRLIKRGTNSIGANDQQENEKVLDQGEMVVTEEQLCDISDDVGTCWRQLGPKLKIKASKIHNIDEEYRSNRDKANALLIMWKEQEGTNATVGRLAAALQNIERKSISDKLLGVNNMKLPTCVTTCEEHMINLSVKCDLDADLKDKLMLCEDERGKKYILKEIGADGGPWNVEEIQKNMRFLESIAVAAHELVKTAEQRRQESLKRISTEVQELRHKLKRVKLDCRVLDSSGGAATAQNDEQSAESQPDGKGLQDELESQLNSCECHRDSWQAMYDALIKLVGEAGQPKEDNFKCLKQLFDFTKELRDQEKKFFPIIEQLQEQKQQLSEPQCTRLEELKKWQRAHTQQLDGVQRLLSSLLDQGKIKATKLMNRRSEPLLSKKLPSSSGFGRRRAKTDSSKSSSKSVSLSELQAPNTKDKISEPLCVRRMCLIDTSKNLTTKKAED